MARSFLSAIKLLTGSTPPAGTAGDTFFNTSINTLQIHDGTNWISQGATGAAGTNGTNAVYDTDQAVISMQVFG